MLISLVCRYYLLYEHDDAVAEQQKGLHSRNRSKREHVSTAHLHEWIFAAWTRTHTRPWPAVAGPPVDVGAAKTELSPIDSKLNISTNINQINDIYPTLSFC